MALELRIKVDSKKAARQIEGFAKKAGGDVSGLEKKQDKLNRTTKKTGISFGGLTAAAGGLSAGFATVINQMEKAVDLFGKQEAATARLTANTENVLVSFEGFLKNTTALNLETSRSVNLLRQQADELQNLTTFGNEQIESGQAMLTTFALTADEISELTPRMLDMAAAQEKATGVGVDLEQVAIAIGKALAVNTLGGLKRAGVVMDSTTESMFKQADQGEKLSILLKVLDDNYKGVAETIGSTSIGKIKQYENQITDLGERLGALSVGPLSAFKGAMVSIGDSILSALEAGNKFINSKIYKIGTGQTSFDPGKALREDIIANAKAEQESIEKVEKAQKEILNTAQKNQKVILSGPTMKELGVDLAAQQMNLLRENTKNAQGEIIKTNEALSKTSRYEFADEFRQAGENAEKAKKQADAMAKNTERLQGFAVGAAQAFERLVDSIESGSLKLSDILGAASLIPGPHQGFLQAGSIFTRALGFAKGGQFMVPGGGGTDSQFVGFRATPGERVTVETPQQQVTNNNSSKNEFNFNVSSLPDEFTFRTQWLPMIKRHMGTLNSA